MKTNHSFRGHLVLSAGLLSMIALASAGCALDGEAAELEEVSPSALTATPVPPSLPELLFINQTPTFDGAATWTCSPVADPATAGGYRCGAGVTLQVARVPSTPLGGPDGNKITIVRQDGFVTESYEGAFAPNGNLSRIWMAGQYTRTTRVGRTPCTSKPCVVFDRLEGPFPFVGRGGTIEGGL